MRRAIGLVAASLLVLLVAAPAALAADGPAGRATVLVAVNGSLDVAAGERADVVTVVDGDATVAGDVDTIVVVTGTLTLSGSARTVVVVDGSVVLTDGAQVSGDVWTLGAGVQQAPTALVGGEIRSLESQLAALGLILLPALVLFLVGFALAVVVAAVVLALVAARQVRTAEALMTGEPVLTFVVGFVAAFAIPLAAVFAMLTVVGAPLGLVVLVIVLPALATAGWIVAAIRVGDWIVARGRDRRPEERPVLAAIVGVVVLAVAGLVPFVTAIASAFGIGSILVYVTRLALGHPVLPRSAIAAPGPGVPPGVPPPPGPSSAPPPAGPPPAGPATAS